MPHDQYRRLERDETARREVYRDLFRAHLDPEIVQQIRSATNGNFALGKEKFANEIERMPGRRARPGKAGRPMRQDRQDKEQFDLL